MSKFKDVYGVLALNATRTQKKKPKKSALMDQPCFAYATENPHDVVYHLFWESYLQLLPVALIPDFSNKNGNKIL